MAIETQNWNMISTTAFDHGTCFHNFRARTFLKNSVDIKQVKYTARIWQCCCQVPQLSRWNSPSEGGACEPGYIQLCPILSIKSSGMILQAQKKIYPEEMDFVKILETQQKHISCSFWNSSKNSYHLPLACKTGTETMILAIFFLYIIIIIASIK